MHKEQFGKYEDSWTYRQWLHSEEFRHKTDWMGTRSGKGAYDTGLGDEWDGSQEPPDVQTKTETDQHYTGWKKKKKPVRLNTTLLIASVTSRAGCCTDLFLTYNKNHQNCGKCFRVVFLPEKLQWHLYISILVLYTRVQMKKLHVLCFSPFNIMWMSIKEIS